MTSSTKKPYVYKVHTEKYEPMQALKSGGGGGGGGELVSSISDFGISLNRSCRTYQQNLLKG